MDLTATYVVGTETITKEFTFTVTALETAAGFTSVLDLHTNAVYTETVVFTGVVTAMMEKGFFISDGTHNLSVYKNEVVTGIAVGDEVTVKGAYLNYNSLYQISNIESIVVNSSGNADPLKAAAVVKTVAELLALDSSLKEMHGAFYVVTGTIAILGDFGNVFLVDGDDEILVSYYSLPTSITALEAEVGKEVTITVFYYTEHDTNGHIVAFDGLADDITTNALSDVDAIAADVAGLDAMVVNVSVGTVVLPTEGANGTTFTNWASDTVAVLDNDGTFVALGVATTTVTLTATATKGSETETVSVEVVVPVLSTVEEVLNMDDDAYFSVSGVVYEITYYGFYIENNGDFVFLYNKEYAGPIVVGDEIQLLGQRSTYNGLIQVNAKSDIEILSNLNDVPTAVAGTVEAAKNDMYQRGTYYTVTGTYSIEAGADGYDDFIIIGATGEKLELYYRSNVAELITFDGQLITIDILTYHNGLALYMGEAADVAVGTPFTDLNNAQAVADLLMINPMVEMNLVLPVENTLTVATITWASDNEAVIDTDGAVTRVSGSDTTVTLTATIVVGGATVTKDFVLTVKDADDMVVLTVSEALLLADGENVLVKGVITGKYKNERIIQDETGAAIWVDSDVFGEIGDEILVRGDLGLYPYNDNNNRQIDNATLLDTLSTGNALVVSAVTDVAAIFAEKDLMHRYTATLTLTLVDGFGYALFNTIPVDYTDPVETLDEQGFKFKISTFAPYFENIYTVGDMIELTFTIQSYSYDNIAMVNVVLPALTDAQALGEAMAAVDVATPVTADVELPTEMYGVAIAWVSDNAAITDMGVVTIPAIGVADATVTLTATYTIGVETDTEVFIVTVPAELPPVAAAPLFFSEYAEAAGGSCKYVEIYNPTLETVNLDGYTIVRPNEGDLFNTLYEVDTLTGMLLPGEVIVVGGSACGNSGDDSFATWTFGTMDFVSSDAAAYFNGDDALGLFFGDTLLDTIAQEGEIAPDTGASWFVGNGDLLDGYTMENCTMIRIPSVTSGETDWEVGQLQWIVLADDRDYSNVGVHTVD